MVWSSEVAFVLVSDVTGRYSVADDEDPTAFDLYSTMYPVMARGRSPR